MFSPEPQQVRLFVKRSLFSAFRKNEKESQKQKPRETKKSISKKFDFFSKFKLGLIQLIFSKCVECELRNMLFHISLHFIAKMKTD